MNEVKYSDSEKIIIEKFIASANKSPNDWANEAYSTLKKTIKDHYIKEQDYTCFYCRQRWVIDHNRAWDTEHIVPRSSHVEFMFEPKNLCITCIECNTSKKAQPILKNKISTRRYPTNPNAYTIVHPHFDEYDDHLEVCAPGQLYRHKTDKGEHTIYIYRLNRFLKIAGRKEKTKSSDKVKQLAACLLTANSEADSDAYQDEMLLHIALNRPKKLGEKLSMKIVKKIIL